MSSFVKLRFVTPCFGMHYMPRLVGLKYDRLGREINI